MTRFYLTAILIFVALTLTRCRHVPPSGVTPTVVRPADVATAVGLGLRGAGTALTVDPKTWSQCVAGVSLQAHGDAILYTALPIETAVDAGECQGQTTGWVIDPSICSGLPGEPVDSHGRNLARSEVRAILNGVLPSASVGLEFWADAQRDAGNVAGCELLSTIADLLSPAGIAVHATLQVIENPGSAYPVQALSWDCSDCRSDVEPLDGHDADPAIPQEAPREDPDPLLSVSRARRRLDAGDDCRRSTTGPR